MTGKNKHCKKYLSQLKFGYFFYEKMSQFIHDNKVKYPEIFEAMKRVLDEAEDEIDKINKISEDE